MEADGTSLSLDTIIKNLSVIELLDFPTDEVKALVADLLLKKLINFLYIKGKCEDYWLYIIIDEAHRMMYPGSPVELLLRESRKYGVGIILASQRPTDFSETILANAGTIIAFQESLDKDAVFLSKQLRIPKVNFQKLKTAGLGYYLFSSNDEAEKIQISPVKDRKEYKEIYKNFDEEERSDYFNKELRRIKKEKDRYKALEESNQKQDETIKELEKEISLLNGTMERKDYLLNKHDIEVKSYEKEIIKISHENDKLFDKLDLKHKKIEELEKKIKK